ncbi:MAG: DUF2779 domain-containing protein, partial [Metamycoplasmataceae bacterium]
MNNEKKITWKHLEKYLTCQPYFVWNDYEDKKIIEEEEIEDENIYWSLEFNENENDDANYVEVHKTGFDVINNSFLKWIKEKYELLGLNLLIIKEKNLEIGILKTKEAMNDPNVDAILYPVFEYNGAISKPTVFDKYDKKISNLNLNTGTKRKDYIRAFFDYEIISKQKYKVRNFSIYTIEIKTFKKNYEMTFEETFYANTSTAKSSKKDDSLLSLKEAAFGNPEKLGGTIFEKISNRELLNLKSKSKKQQLYLQEIDYYLVWINQARNAERKIVGSFDIKPWGNNKFLRQIIQEDFPNLLPISGSLIKNKKIIELVEDGDINKYYDDHKATRNIKNQKNSINYDALKRFLESIGKQKVVWYDFEGFSLPFPIMEYTLPYQQLIFQVSVIKTEMDEIKNINNIVIDPKVINYIHFFEIIDAIFDENVDVYVVYNETYENSKLKDMGKILDEQAEIQKDFNFSLLVKKYNWKISKIIERTKDLLDLFKINSINKNLPPIFLWELYGFSSIKAIEKYITKKGYELEVMIKPYANLEVKNGLMAMSKAIDRRLGGIGDNEWIETQEQLKEYCENDVKAMLMVYHFAKKILEERK